MRTTSPWLLLGVLAGCTGKDEPAYLTVTDANNYSYTDSIHVPATETVSGQDVTIHWEKTLHDIQCHDIDPAQDINTANLVRFGNLTQEEVALGIAQDTLDQNSVTGYVNVPTTGTTSTSLLAMSFGGTPIDVVSEYTEDGGTYLLLLQTGDVPGQGARMLQFLTPTSSSTNTDVAVPDGCGFLDIDVDMQSLQTLSIPADGPWTLDYSALTTNGQGGELSLGRIDRMTIGYYQGLTAADLETQFLDLEIVATDLYTQSVVGTSAELDKASDGQQWLTHIADDGLWILALQCSTCYNPAPVFLTVLSPLAATEG